MIKNTKISYHEESLASHPNDCFNSAPYWAPCALNLYTELVESTRTGMYVKQSVLVRYHQTRAAYLTYIKSKQCANFPRQFLSQHHHHKYPKRSTHHQPHPRILLLPVIIQYIYICCHGDGLRRNLVWICLCSSSSPLSNLLENVLPESNFM